MWRYVGRQLALFTLGLVLLTGCATTSPKGTPSPSSAQSSSPSPTPTEPWSLVALGDSVPAGVACACTPYPELSASDLGPAVTARNDAVSGATTTDVIDQLNSASDVINDVKAASLVEVEIGANDVPHSNSCLADVLCYVPELAALPANLRAIVARVHELTRANVVMLDYWSVWLGGQYAQEQGQAYVDTAATVTDRVNGAIQEVAAETGSAYVDLRAAFKGPDYSYDETHYLAPDGDHPNAAGHEKIASALVGVVQGQTPGT